MQPDELLTIAGLPRLLSRPDWDSWYLAGTQWVALRGDCRRRKVGAILVSQDHRVLAVGYNGTDPGAPGCLAGACPRGLLSYAQQPAGTGYGNCIARHAEHNALRNIPGIDPLGTDAWWLLEQRATMYVTDEPCEDCRERMSLALVHRAVWPGGSTTL